MIGPPSPLLRSSQDPAPLAFQVCLFFCHSGRNVINSQFWRANVTKCSPKVMHTHSKSIS